MHILRLGTICKTTDKPNNNGFKNCYFSLTCINLDINKSDGPWCQGLKIFLFCFFVCGCHLQDKKMAMGTVGARNFSIKFQLAFKKTSQKTLWEWVHTSSIYMSWAELSHMPTWPQGRLGNAVFIQEVILSDYTGDSVTKEGENRH